MMARTEGLRRARGATDEAATTAAAAVVLRRHAEDAFDTAPSPQRRAALIAAQIRAARAESAWLAASETEMVARAAFEDGPVDGDQGFLVGVSRLASGDDATGGDAA